MTADGRYTVCRMNLGQRIAYVAYRRGRAANRRDEPHASAVQIDEIVMPATASDSERLASLRSLQGKCAEDARRQLAQP